jgi:ATP-dependent RNA helicase DOB1
MEVDAADELLMAELLFDNTFATLSPAAAAALASCFIASEMEKPTATAVAAAKSLPDDLAGAHERLRAAATRIAAVLADARLGALDEGAGYTATFSSHLMPIVHAWTSGAEFAEICQLDEALFEGTIVRVIKRLDELLAELVGAAKVMGNEALAEKLEAARGAMHRDIVFSASLYTLEDG